MAGSRAEYRPTRIGQTKMLHVALVRKTALQAVLVQVVYASYADQASRQPTTETTV
jgi:hypothetical protein